MNALDKYLSQHSTQEGEALQWVRRQTALRTNHSRMLSGPVQGQLLSMLVRMSGSRRILELGAFTGYSTICMASALPQDGHLDTLELNDELEDVISGGLERAGVADRVSVIFGDCLQTIGTLSGPYDFVFMDANKRDYPKYYELVLPLVRPGGWILADNVLWDGKVYADPVPADAQTSAISLFNDLVSRDDRVENVIIPLRDGLNLIRKK